MLRCSDQSFYVGSTSYKDVEARVIEHNDAKYVGYTTFRRPVVLVWAMWFDDLRDAHATERRLKGWSRAKKKALITEDEKTLTELSRRRGGLPPPKEKARSKRDLTAEFQASRARHPEVRPGAKRRGAPKDE